MDRLSAEIAFADPAVAARSAATFAVAAVGLTAVAWVAGREAGEATLQTLLAVALAVGAGGAVTNFVRLPRREEPRASRPAASPAEEQPAEPMAALRVLVAEDNPLHQLVVHALLHGVVGSLTIVSDGVEALEALRRQDFDLVLMDVKMPHLDGPAVVASVRRGEAGRRDTPIVALTSEALPADAERLRAVGFDDHLGKPFQPADLLAIVARAGQETSAARLAAA